MHVFIFSVDATDCFFVSHQERNNYTLVNTCIKFVCCIHCFLIVMDPRESTVVIILRIIIILLWCRKFLKCVT